VTKQEKREQRIRQNLNQVRFSALDTLLQTEGFDRADTGGSHVHYHHPKFRGVVTVATHAAFVPSYQVKQALVAIDAVRI
jgi:predicted RNA binding protein YcfA (HicA-like mRNA interferase family)